MTTAELSVLAPGTPLGVALPAPGAPRSHVGGGSWQQGLASPAVGPGVLATAVHGRRVVVGGEFTYGTAGMPNGAFSRIALWDGTGWQALGSGMDGAVRAVAIVGDQIYAGGDFSTAGGVPAPRLARWDGTAWTAVGGGITHPDAEYECTVLALACDGSGCTWAGPSPAPGTPTCGALLRWSSPAAGGRSWVAASLSLSEVHDEWSSPPPVASPIWLPHDLALRPSLTTHQVCAHRPPSNEPEILTWTPSHAACGPRTPMLGSSRGRSEARSPKAGRSWREFV
jgi:hypothetical protein